MGYIILVLGGRISAWCGEGKVFPKKKKSSKMAHYKFKGENRVIFKVLHLKNQIWCYFQIFMKNFHVFSAYFTTNLVICPYSTTNKGSLLEIFCSDLGKMLEQA